MLLQHSHAAATAAASVADNDPKSSPADLGCAAGRSILAWVDIGPKLFGSFPFSFLRLITGFVFTQEDLGAARDGSNTEVPARPSIENGL